MFVLIEKAQVVMKIVDPQVAMALLHRKPDQIPPIMPSNTSPIQLQQNVGLKSLKKYLLVAI